MIIVGVEARADRWYSGEMRAATYGRKRRSGQAAMAMNGDGWSELPAPHPEVPEGVPYPRMSTRADAELDEMIRVARGQ